METHVRVIRHLQVSVLRQDEAGVHEGNGEVEQHRAQNQQHEQNRLDQLPRLLLLPQLYTHTHNLLKTH